jgi:CelD/BcsL family acetyltransferase involved in cellulose biosynthesis
MLKPEKSISKTRTEPREPNQAEVWVEAVSTTAELAQFIPGWEALARIALEPNVFYEPWNLEPAIKSFGSDKQSRFLFVFHHDHDRGKSPILFMPLEKDASFRGRLSRLLTAWQHPYCQLHTPLIHPRFAHDAWRALFSWTRSDRDNVSLLEFRLLLGEGRSHQAMIDVLRQDRLHSYSVHRHTRAALATPAPADTSHFDQMLSAGRHKELRRQRRRLEEMDGFAVRQLGVGEDVEAWIEQFIALEASGWKGVQNTAFASNAASADYFRTICREAHARGRLQMLGFFAAERPIAMKCNFLSGQGAFALKIAYDETLNKYSPGVLLEMETIALLKARGGVRWVDSCAVPEHVMINGLWAERRTIEHLLISSGVAGHLSLAALQAGRSLKRIISSSPLERSHPP